MADLLANSAGLSQSELAAAQDDLKRRSKAQLHDFDSLTKQLVAQAERDVLPYVNVDQSEARLLMKERHLAELSDLMKQYSQKPQLVKQYEADAEEAREQARRFAEIARKSREEFEKMKARKRQLAEERKRALDEEIRRMESELEAERLREEEREKQKQEERERARREQLEEKRARERKEIEDMNVSEAERAKLLQQHDADMKRLEETQAAELQSSQDALQAKLEARRNKRKAAETSRLEKERLMEEEGDRRKQVLDGLAEDARSKASSGGQVSTSASAGVSAAPVPGVLPLPGNNEQDWVKMLMNSPLFKQINDLQEMIDRNTSGPNADVIIGSSAL